MPYDAQPSTAAPPSYGGAGGKVRRKERKAAATPYDRPRGWISRFVDPAKRLFPSLFSPPIAADEVQTDVEQGARDQIENFSNDLVAPRPTGPVGPRDTKGKSELHISDTDRLDKKESHSNSVLPDVEQMIKGKTFSREEIDHLMEILRSRVVDDEQERKTFSPTVPEKIERTQISHEKLKTSIENEEGEMDRYQLASSTPLPWTTRQTNIGASPVDIARAYMGSRIPEAGFTSSTLTLRNDNLGPAGDLSSKPLMPSSLSKAPICWPGAMTQNQQGYTTPQSQKSRYGVYSSSRTPYSRTMYSNSKSKLIPLQGDSEKFSHISSTPLKPMGTPLYGKSLTNVAEGSYGSGGPMRRTRNKFSSATPARESSLLHSVQRSPWTKESNADLMLEKAFEPGRITLANFQSVNSKVQNSEVGLSSVHPHSSKLARDILAQIDRPVTLKERSKELKVAISWKDTPATALATPVQNISSPSTSGLGVSSRSRNVDGVQFYAQTNGGNNTLPQEKSNNARGHAEKDLGSGATVTFDKTNAISGGNDERLPILQTLDQRTKSLEQEINNNLPNKSWLFGEQSKGLYMANNSARSEPQNSQRKPVLPSIAINKPGLRTSFSSDTSTGFSFPVATSSSTFTDLPTPTVMPSFSSSPPKRSNVSVDLPGSKITIAPPVISFASTGNAYTPNDDLAPEFKFGSGKARLSFAIEGDDTASAHDASSSMFKFGSGKSRLDFGSIDSDAVCC